MKVYICYNVYVDSRESIKVVDTKAKALDWAAEYSYTEFMRREFEEMDLE